jgi:hypothetical protein
MRRVGERCTRRLIADVFISTVVAMSAALERVRGARSLSMLSVVLSSAYLAYALSSRCWLDLATYVRATNDLRAGVDPYRLDVTLRFVYHPLVLMLMRALDIIDLRSVMVVLYGVSALCCVRALRGVLGANSMPVIGLACACGGAGVWSITTGNLTAFMHLALLAALFTPGRAGSRLSWALLAALVMIKPYFLAYGLLPVVIERDHVRQLRRWLIVAISCSALMLLAWLAAPAWTSRFLRALFLQTLGSGNVGMSFFGLLLRVVRERILIALVVHVACALSVLSMAVTYCITRPQRYVQPSASIGVLYFALTWANPRMMVYDLFPALLALGTALALEVPDYAVHAALALCVSAVPLLHHVFGLDMGATLESEALWQTVASCYLAVVLARTSHGSRARAQDCVTSHDLTLAGDEVRGRTSL